MPISYDQNSNKIRKILASDLDQKKKSISDFDFYKKVKQIWSININAFKKSQHRKRHRR